MAKRPQSIASQHADWLRLIEVSGPFLSLPVIVQTFGHGLDKIESEAMRRIRTGYAEWKEGTRSDATDRVWIEMIITGLLEHEAASLSRFDELSKVPATLRHRVEEHAEVLAPQLVIKEADQALPDGTRVLVCIYPRAQRLDRAVAGSRWSASPQSRMAELCRATGVRLGLVTNGEQWTLVDAPKDETIGYATWYAQLWLDEPGTLSAFRSLLGRHRLFAVGQDDTLESLLSKSRENQHEVTTQLGLQVRRAVEVLVRAIDRADQDSKRALLEHIGVTEIYQAAVTVMMRLVFLLSAEERGLLLLGDPLFDQHYAVSTLCEQLREAADQHGEEVLERRRDAWCRLLAAFRAVHGGVQHDRLQIRAYGGGLFDPDRFPFLEGRPSDTSWKGTQADPLPIDNRTVLHALESLQFLQVKIGSHVESRRLSFRALGIEQIGHVYEGLLDHKAVRAKEVTLGLVGSEGAEPEVALAVLDEKRRRGVDDLIELLHEEKVKSGKPAIKKLLSAEVPVARLARMERLCRDPDLWKRVEPFAALIRDDDFGQPIILLIGQLYATAGQDRRSTGTHYTPVSLTQPVVEHTLEPLVYVGPAEGKPREEWQLRAANEILDLKVCDMACGSGAFLVQACRYLGDRLLEAWAIAEKAATSPNPGKLTFPTIAFDGSQADGERNLVPRDPDERLLVARRLIAQRCLFGVDINPMACEMAKLSIWLLTLSRDKPFSFINHAIRSGDSLLGIHAFEQLKRFSFALSGTIQYTFAGLPLTDLIEQASGTRLQIEQINSANIGHVQVQARLLDDVEKQTARLKFSADMLTAAYLQPARNASERRVHQDSAAIRAGQLAMGGTSEECRQCAQQALSGKRPFHWCIEFPEIINKRGGFDAIIGNPPFAAAPLRAATQPWLDSILAAFEPFAEGAFDLVLLFWCRTLRHLLRSGGRYGLVGPTALLADERPWQKWISSNRAPDWALLLPVDFFGSARIRTVAISGDSANGGLLSVENRDPLSTNIPRSAMTQWPPEYANWNAVLSEQTEAGTHLSRLDKVAEIQAACATAVAYELIPHIVDSQVGTGSRLHTTGAIDRYKSRWGVSTTRYLKSDYQFPRYASGAGVPRAVKAAMDRQLTPRIIVGGLTTVIEAWYDADADAAGTKSTWLVAASEASVPALNWWLLAILNSASFSRLYAGRYGARSMSGRQMTIQRDAISSIEVPEWQTCMNDIQTDVITSEMHHGMGGVPVPRMVAAIAAYLQNTADDTKEWRECDRMLHLLVGVCYWRNVHRAVDDYAWWSERVGLPTLAGAATDNPESVFARVRNFPLARSLLAMPK